MKNKLKKEKLVKSALDALKKQALQEEETKRLIGAGPASTHIGGFAA